LLSAKALVDVLLDEADVIDELVDAIVEQRETVREKDHALLQDQMKYVQEIFFDVQALEARRERLVQALAGELRCPGRLANLVKALPEAEGTELRSAGDRFGHSIFALKAEMTILSGLIEHNERFSALLLSEWRRLSGDGFMQSEGLDFRG
jgi:uncharacterized coiled-coil protein SlyX